VVALRSAGSPFPLARCLLDHGALLGREWAYDRSRPLLEEARSIFAALRATRGSSGPSVPGPRGYGVTWAAVFAAFVASHVAGDFLVQTEWQAVTKVQGFGTADGSPRADFPRRHLHDRLLPALVWVANDRTVARAIVVAALVAVPHVLVDDGHFVRVWLRRIKHAPSPPQPLADGRPELSRGLPAGRCAGRRRLMATNSFLRGVPVLAGLFGRAAGPPRGQVSRGAGSRRGLDHAQGKRPTACFILRSGRVEVLDEGPPETLVRVLRRGDVLGELALLREGCARLRCAPVVTPSCWSSGEPSSRS